MHIVFSGSTVDSCNPERVLAYPGPDVMLSYLEIRNEEPVTRKRFNRHVQRCRNPKPTDTTDITRMFMDSGAHGLFTKEVLHKQDGDYSFYADRNGRLTDTYRQYLDSYAAFIQENDDVIDYYVTGDVIFNPDLSWTVLQYLERKHNLRPMPVIHYGTDMTWITKHLNAGYELIGLGGLGQKVRAREYEHWADGAFKLLTNKNGTSKVRLHGFAMTSYRLLKRYPWWSVDSATWTKVAGFGSIYVPRRRGGHFTFDLKPDTICVSTKSPLKAKWGKHLATLNSTKMQLVEDWLYEINLPLGNKQNVMNDYKPRKIANLRFFRHLERALSAQRSVRSADRRTLEFCGSIR